MNHPNPRADRITAVALAATLAVGISVAALTANPNVAMASDPRPCTSIVNVTKTGAHNKPLAGAVFDVKAPAGSVLVPPGEFYSIFTEHNAAHPGTDAYLERVQPVQNAITELANIRATRTDWTRWYEADETQQQMYMESWRTSEQAGEYRAVLEDSIAKASALPNNIGASVVADSEAGLAALDATLTTTDYAEWVTQHQALYAAVTLPVIVEHGMTMTAEEEAMDADAKAAVVARYSDSGTYTSGSDGTFEYAVWNPGTLLGPDCEAASITSTLTETEAPAGYDKLAEAVTVAPQTTEDGDDYVKAVTIENKLTPTPEPTPEPKPTPTPTPTVTPDKPTGMPKSGV